MTDDLSSAPRPLDPGPALVVGVTGIAGGAVADALVAQGVEVLGLSRSGRPRPGVTTLSADLTDADGLRSVLADQRPTTVFLTAWARQDTEEETSGSTAPWCATCWRRSRTPPRAAACATSRC